MSIAYRRIGATVLVAVMLGVFVPAKFERTQAAEQNELPRYQGQDVTSFAVAALEESVVESEVPSREPFGLTASASVKGRILNKWRFVTKRLPREHTILMSCRMHASTCPPAAGRFLAVLDKAQARHGWARIAELNRVINLDIKPVDDMTQYGVADLWATPLMAFKSNEGDCEDYAIAKYVALSELGFAPDDLRLIIVRAVGSREDHAVTAVRFEDDWLVLDNRTLEIRHDADIRGYQPLFVIDGNGIKRVTAWDPQPRDTVLRADPVETGSLASAGYPDAQLML